LLSNQRHVSASKRRWRIDNFTCRDGSGSRLTTAAMTTARRHGGTASARRAKQHTVGASRLVFLQSFSLLRSRPAVCLPVPVLVNCFAVLPFCRPCCFPGFRGQVSPQSHSSSSSASQYTSAQIQIYRHRQRQRKDKDSNLLQIQYSTFSQRIVEIQHTTTTNARLVFVIYLASAGHGNKFTLHVNATL
jgi:hypothetical protein